MLHVLGIVHQVAPLYRWSSFNCWFFADTVIQTLHVLFQGQWLVNPRRSWTKRFVKWVGKDTSAATNWAMEKFRCEMNAADREVEKLPYWPEKEEVSTIRSFIVCIGAFFNFRSTFLIAALFS